MNGRKNMKKLGLLFVLFDMVKFNRLLFPNDKMHDDVVFADRFRNQLTMFWNSYIDMAISTPSCSHMKQILF